MATSEHDLQSLLHKDSPKTLDLTAARKALVQLNFSEEQIGLLLSADNSPESDTDALKGILLNQGRLLQVSKSLNNIVDGLQSNPSILTQIVDRWSALNLWQRILGGALVSVPTAIIGVTANVGLLIAISGTNLVSYTLGGYVFDEHHRITEDLNRKLKEGVLDISVIVELAVASLENIRQKFELEVKRFKEQNQIYQDNVGKLSDELNTLRHQIANAAAVEKYLQGLTSDLRVEAELLKQDLGKNTVALQENERKTALIQMDLQKCLQQLSERSAEFNRLSEEMAREIDSVKTITTSLSEAVVMLAESDASAREQQDFQTRLVTALQDHSREIQTHFGTTHAELAHVKQQLFEYQTRYKELLAKAEGQKAEWAIFDDHAKAENPGRKIVSDAKSLQLLGLYSILPPPYTAKAEEALPADERGLVL